MSPSEFDLRGALHDGEGEGIDVEALIGHASAVQRARHAKRVQLASVAALVVLAGGIGTAVALRSDSPSTSAASAASAGSAAGSTQPKAAPFSVEHGPTGQDSVGSVNGGGAYSQNGVAAAAPACAASLPAVPHPELSSSSRPASMFPKPVTVILVCGYDGSGKLAHLASGTEVSATFSGAAATAITHSIDTARTTATNDLCPFIEHLIKTVTITGTLNADGKPQVIVAQPYCGGSASNGTTTRYDWTPPAQLVNLINEKQPFSR